MPDAKRLSVKKLETIFTCSTWIDAFPLKKYNSRPILRFLVKAYGTSMQRLKERIINPSVEIYDTLIDNPVIGDKVSQHPVQDGSKKYSTSYFERYETSSRRPLIPRIKRILWGSKAVIILLIVSIDRLQRVRKQSAPVSVALRWFDNLFDASVSIAILEVLIDPFLRLLKGNDSRELAGVLKIATGAVKLLLCVPFSVAIGVLDVGVVKIRISYARLLVSQSLAVSELILWNSNGELNGYFGNARL